MNQLFSRARTRAAAAQPPSTDGSAAPGQSPRRRRAKPVLIAGFVVAFVGGTGLGVAGVAFPPFGGEPSTTLADGASVDLSDSTEGAAEDVSSSRDGDQPSRSEIRDAGGIAEFGAQRRQELAEQERGAQSAEQAQQVADAEAVRRAALAQAEAERVAAEVEAQRVAAVDAALADPRSAGRTLAAERGWAGEQFQCLDSLWTKESGWTPTADNPTSSAYGIPQSLPGEKMASAGADWATNPVTQISWGLTYIRDVYGTPCEAWAHSRATDWY